jgi:hypothetical protein
VKNVFHIAHINEKDGDSQLTLNLLPLTILARPLLLSMEPQILEQKDLSIFTVLDGLLGLLAYAVR